MKHSRILTTLIILVLIAGQTIFGQDRDLQFYRSPDKTGVNIFETSKKDTVKFDGLKVRIGGASTLQFQGLSHTNNAAFVDDGNGKNMNELIDLSKNFNLATANLDLDVQLADGLRMHLRSYLSSRHHTETYVKGGYLQIDKLDFIQKGLLKDVMEKVTIKVGHMENNYGDAHFRRSDNAMALFNPFVGNLILDAFTTEVGGEVYYKNNGVIAMLGLSNGKLNQNVTDEGKTGIAVLGKLGYDKQLNEDLRVRVTGSIYTNSKTERINLYGGDRSGARYYSVIQSITATADDFRSGRWNPNFSENITSLMFNTFVKFHGLEVFGTYERPEGGDAKGSSEKRTWNQIAVEALYRFGMNENFYVGGRFNTASGKMSNKSLDEITINRIQAAFGWFMTDNVLAKLEYVSQKYDGFAPTSIYSDAKFNGVMLEAVISF